METETERDLIKFSKKLRKIAPETFNIDMLDDNGLLDLLKDVKTEEEEKRQKRIPTSDYGKWWDWADEISSETGDETGNQPSDQPYNMPSPDYTISDISEESESDISEESDEENSLFKSPKKEKKNH